MTSGALLARLRHIVGRRHLLTGQRTTERFRRGFRSGEASANQIHDSGRHAQE